MTLLGLPWGPLASWDSAGKCFITLAALISTLAAISFYLLLRIGVKRLFLIGASACMWLSLGPLPADLGRFPQMMLTKLLADLWLTVYSPGRL